MAAMIYQKKPVSDDVIAIAKRAREIYLAGFPRTKAPAWEQLLPEEQHVWIPYATAAFAAMNEYRQDNEPMMGYDGHSLRI